MIENFGVLNWFILGGYIIVNLLLGLVIGKNIKNFDDFYFG